MLTYLPFLMILIIFGVVAGLGFYDRKKKRSITNHPSVSFMVPCYNDSGSVGQTLESIYEMIGPDANVIVIDDCSTDGSREKLTALKERFGFKLILNSVNLGKSSTLNDNFHHIKDEIVAFVDADVVANRQSFIDALTRLQRPDVGAVSCPYRSLNRGFLPLMQTIEYNMLTFIQGAYNVYSAIRLWGGFILIKRKVFEKVGGFTLNAITEDMDMAFKINKLGWRVEQSFYPIYTFVPDTIRQWLKQKMRWSAGGFQCLIRYHDVWLKNPLHLFFIFSFCLLSIFSTLKMGKNIVIWDTVFDFFNGLNRYQSLWFSAKYTGLFYGTILLKDLAIRLAFTLLSLPFVLPLISTINRIYFCFMVIPFSILYIPFFTVISIVGVFSFLRKSRLLRFSTRGW